MKIGTVEFGAICNVRKSGDEEGVYFADVEISVAEGFPMDVHLFCARDNDFAKTGQWVYQQIIEGNFEGDVTQLIPYADPSTGLVPVETRQPTVIGAETL